MKAAVSPDLERRRVRTGAWGSDPWDGVNGMFIIDGPCGVSLAAIVSNGSPWPFDGPAWEHVSVSTAHRTPNWREMEFVRDLFWNPEELVMQFSVPRAAHINIHPYCLHLWRPIGVAIPLPPSETVGVTGARPS